LQQSVIRLSLDAALGCGHIFAEFPPTPPGVLEPFLDP
jgi:hypothetical protein